MTVGENATDEPDEPVETNEITFFAPIRPLTLPYAATDPSGVAGKPTSSDRRVLPL
jgi:hypothetical protein